MQKQSLNRWQRFIRTTQNWLKFPRHHVRVGRLKYLPGTTAASFWTWDVAPTEMPFTWLNR